MCIPICVDMDVFTYVSQIAVFLLYLPYCHHAMLWCILPQAESYQWNRPRDAPQSLINEEGWKHGVLFIYLIMQIECPVICIYYLYISILDSRSNNQHDVFTTVEVRNTGHNLDIVESGISDSTIRPFQTYKKPTVLQKKHKCWLTYWI